MSSAAGREGDSVVLLELFWAWFQIGLFSIGGGYAALPIIRDVTVEQYAWLTAAQFADLVVIDEMAPGPIILNSATFVGAQAAGLPGAVVSTLGCLAGPVLLVSLIAHFYFRYQELPVIKAVLGILRPVIVALLASSALSLISLSLWGEQGAGGGGTDWMAACIGAAAFAVLKTRKPNPILVMLGCGVLGVLCYSLP